jgi:hypothetical protein
MIPLIMDESLVKIGDNSFINWIPGSAPHMVIFGSTGSGKTYFCKQLLGRISLYMPDAHIYVCDFKGDDDFLFLDGCERFYRFDKCADGLRDFYEQFQARQSGEDVSRNMLVLYFDEWASFCNANSDDKKKLEAEKRKLANLLMLGRSFRCHVIVSQQRADAVYFNAVRDNFNVCVGLGNLSEESKDMFFSAYKKEMKPDRKRGTGYMLSNGTNLQSVLVPEMSNFDKLHDIIREGLTRKVESR